MGNDLENSRPAYLNLQENIEWLIRTFKPPDLSIYKQMERDMKLNYEYHIKAIQDAELSRRSALLSEISHADRHWLDLMINKASAMNWMFEDIKRKHQEWLDSFKPTQDTIDRLQAEAAATFSLFNLTHRLTITERLFAGIDFESLKLAIDIPTPVIPDLERMVLNVTSTYKNLADSIWTIPEATRLPVFVMPAATREVFTTGHTLDVICTREGPETEKNTDEGQLIAEVEQEVSGCITLLKAVEPALVRPYIGAHDALHSKSIDRARHIFISLREFWNHLLRSLAPDELVKAWMPKDGAKNGLLHNGSPTRKARILYVCRDLNHDPLTDFVVQDTSALVKLVELFNRVHELDPELTDAQLRALLLRTDSWLMYILQIWKEMR